MVTSYNLQCHQRQLFFDENHHILIIISLRYLSSLHIYMPLFLNVLNAVVSKNGLITVQVVHLVLILVVVAENDVEDDSSDERRATDTSVHPEVLGVDGDGNQGLGDGSTESVGEEVQRLHKGLHGRGSLSVSILETSNRDENLRDTNEDVGRSLNGDVDIVGQLSLAVLSSRTLSGVLVAGSSAIDEMLDDGSVGKTQSGEPEANGNSHNGLKLDASLSKDGVNDLVEDGGEDQDGDGVEVLHKVVGHAMALHLAGLGDKVGRELAVANPEDGVLTRLDGTNRSTVKKLTEDKDLAGSEGTLELVDEVIVPGDNLGLSVLSAPGRLGSIHVALLDHHAKGLEGVGDDGSLGRTVDISLAAPDEDENSDVEHAEAHQVGSPESLVLLHEGGSHQRQSTDVDAPIEDHVDTLVGDGGINDDTLSILFRLDGHSASLILVGNQGGNVGLDTTGSKTDDDNGDDVSSLSSAVIHCCRERGCP